VPRNNVPCATAYVLHKFSAWTSLCVMVWWRHCASRPVHRITVLNGKSVSWTWVDFIKCKFRFCNRFGGWAIEHSSSVCTYILCGQRQGCQMVYFQTKNPKSDKYWRVLQWKMLKYFWAIWSIFWLFGIFCGHLLYYVVIWYIFRRFGMLYQEKSGNPGQRCPLLINRMHPMLVVTY
jgi:hypothetical protein